MQTVEFLSAITYQGSDLDRLGDLADRTTELVEASRAPATRRAYESDSRIFLRWCSQQAIRAVVPGEVATVALFLTGERLSGSPRRL